MPSAVDLLAVDVDDELRASSRNVVETLRSVGSRRASAIRPRAAAVSAGMPTLSWSCSSNWNPARLPMPRIVGGLKASTVAFAICAQLRAQAAHDAVGRLRGALRSSHGLSETNISARFGALHAELRAVGLEDDRRPRETCVDDASIAARHALGLRQRRAFGQLHRDVEVAEVLIGQKAGRDRLVGEVRRRRARARTAQHDHAPAHAAPASIAW